MDTFFGYSQIQMNPEGKEKITLTKKSLYCYKVMTFGLKNVGMTYQRLVNKVSKKQLGSNMEAYIDDILVKSIQISDHIKDLEEVFDMLRQHQMKLNLIKYIFGIILRKFLRFLVTNREIEANPEKIRIILYMRHPSNKKEVQQLAGGIVTLSRFISW